ncbi:MAG: DUF1934 domain-containing protein [Eubacteriaceae bacterium]|nr:DUF1934 domain-containing protein [Eubacteriaceae bacterium]
MKEIRLKIKGSYIYESAEEDQVELITDGKLYKRGKIIYLTYDESEMSGMEGCKTRLTLEGQSVRMTRKGSAVDIDTEIHFEKGKRFTGYYDTPYGAVEMEVLTNDLTNNVTSEGSGSVSIDYNVSLKGLSEGRSRLNIEILQ